MKEIQMQQKLVENLLKITYKESNLGFDYPTIRPYIYLADGSFISIQASMFHYCYPRENLKDGKYQEVEVKIFKDMNDRYENDIIFLREYKEGIYEDGSIFSNVPIELIGKLILSHGGISSSYIGTFFKIGDVLKSTYDNTIDYENKINKDSKYIITNFLFGRDMVELKDTNLEKFDVIQIDSKNLLYFDIIEEN